MTAALDTQGNHSRPMIPVNGEVASSKPEVSGAQRSRYAEGVRKSSRLAVTRIQYGSSAMVANQLRAMLPITRSTGAKRGVSREDYHTRRSRPDLTPQPKSLYIRFIPIKAGRSCRARVSIPPLLPV